MSIHHKYTLELIKLLQESGCAYEPGLEWVAVADIAGKTSMEPLPMSRSQISQLRGLVKAGIIPLLTKVLDDQNIAITEEAVTSLPLLDTPGYDPDVRNV